MVFVKPPVQRFATAALKSLTYGQTVVAATPLWRKAEKHQHRNTLRYGESRHASTTAAAARPESSHHEVGGLEKYFDAWQKQKKDGATTWQQYQFAKTIEWHGASVPQEDVPAKSAVLEDVVEEIDTSDRAPALRRSYTTSALNDFGKLFDNNEAAEAAVLAQVSDSLAEEVQRTKDESASSESQANSNTSPITTPESVSSVSSEQQLWTEELTRLANAGHYNEIPGAFHSMLRAGIQQPSPSTYHALLTSVLALTKGKHQRVPKALEVYSDMLQRGVTPNSETFSLLVELLAQRTLDVSTMLQSSNVRLARYGGLDGTKDFIFSSGRLEHTMLVEDNSNSIAMKIFHRAVASNEQITAQACASLIAACASIGAVNEMGKILQYGKTHSLSMQSSIFPPVIEAYGRVSDLKSAVEAYDQYKDLAILQSAGEIDLIRNDNEIYASLIKAYGSADRLKGGLKFLSEVQATISDAAELSNLRQTVAEKALLPLALRDATCRDAFELTTSLTGDAYQTAMAKICVHAADNNLLDQSTAAFTTLSTLTQDLVEPAVSMLAMHIRNGNVEAAEPYWRIIEAAPASLSFVEPSTMRTIALSAMGQSERGLRQARRMFARIRDSQPESRLSETIDHIAEAIETTGNHLIRSQPIVQAEASAELMRAMMDNGSLIDSLTLHLLARLSSEQIMRLSAADLELFLRVQASMVVKDSIDDIAGPARFACLLENLTARSIMPSAETESIIERTLVNLDNAELSTMWHNYRYPPVLQSPVSVFSAQHTAEDSFDPYIAKTDTKGSNVINELLERGQGRRSMEAMTKFRNMRRVGRVPRMFTYGKLIESAAKDNNFTLAREILEMAKQDVPFDARYRVVRFGWQQILDHMVSGCLVVGRRDLAANYHQDMLAMGMAPSANTFGLYITTLKDNAKTFDEASEAVKIFHQAKSEGVEPSSFLYNALIGKLGKARRIDDCLFYFAEMRTLGIRPTSVTYGTIVNALCRVSDEKFAEEIFEEMESCSNYKPRPAPYHSLMQFFLTTKRDRAKVLSYYERMRSRNIEPTVHTFKLLIDAHATLEPVDMNAAKAVLASMKNAGIQPEAVHYASLIHAQGCVMHDMEGARQIFNDLVASDALRLQPCVYQAMFESFNANHMAKESESLLADMAAKRVEYTAYIANALIHGWTMEKDIVKARAAFDRVKMDKREPSTYEAMVRAYLAVEDRDSAKLIVREALSRGYPSAVAAKVAELVR